MDAIEARQHLSEINPPKYKVQDLVVCNQGPGHIIGSQPCKTYENTQRHLAMWGKKYPGFFDEYIYMVMFDTPQKSLSFEEFIDIYPDIKEERIQEIYDELPLVPMVMCPEQEVILEWES